MDNCIRCKGRGFCSRKYCPHILKGNAMFRVGDRLTSAEFSSSAPAPFVGHVGYPYVNVGILTPPEKSDEAWKYDAPRHWSDSSMQIPEIVDIRSSLVNSRARARVIDANKFVQVSQEVGMAAKPVDIDISLEDKPSFRLNTSTQMAPMGPKAELKSAKITSNPHVHTKVDKVVGDTDLRAGDAVEYLYNSDFDENFLTRLLSVGNIGMKADRKMVPTRWAITAVDDTLGKRLHQKVRDLPAIDEHTAYFGSYLGNFYLVMLLPDVWGYELFETYMPDASWNQSRKVDYTTDYEGYAGRSKYADNCAGGYYTARLAVLEKLAQMKKQAGCLVVRVITGDYSVPLGVWVTREAARKSVGGKPIRFASLELMRKYAEGLCRKKFGFDAGTILKNSIILKNARVQKKLTSF